MRDAAVRSKYKVLSKKYTEIVVTEHVHRPHRTLVTRATRRTHVWRIYAANRDVARNALGREVEAGRG